jgi:hypothetical protein
MTILSTYSSGYSLAAGGILTITKTGTIGGTGLTADAGSTTVNQGLIEAAAAAGGAGLAGSAAARMSGRATSSGTIVGGAGGSGVAGSGTSFGNGAPGGLGGVGGAGVSLASGNMTNTGQVTGGVGGYGGAGAYGPNTGGNGGTGAAGGAGVALGGGTLTNTGTLTGGGGGRGGTGGNAGLAAGNGGGGGSGGAGAALAGGEVINRGVILGGGAAPGGAGGSAAFGKGATGTGGAAGDGVLVIGGGAVVNQAGGTIFGLNGVEDGGTGSVTVTNFASIAGAGDSVLFRAASDHLIAEAGSAFTGEIVGGGGGLTLAGGTGTIAGLGGSATLTGAVSGVFEGFGSYALSGAAAWTLAGSASLAAAQTFTVGAGAVLKLSGTSLADGGEIELQGVSTKVARLLVNGTDTLTGGGFVSLSNGGHIVAGTAGGTLTIAGATIAGGGAIEGALGLTNDGVIDATSGTMLIGVSPTIVNDGLVESTGSATLLLRNATLDSSGGGSVLVGHRLQLDDAILVGGTLTVAAGGVLQSQAGGGTIDGTVANSGLVQAQNGALTITGAVSGSGSARVVGTGVLEVDGTLGENAIFTAGATGRLVLGGGFTGKVFGLSKSGANQVDLKSFAFAAGDTASYAGGAAGGTLTILDGASSVIATLELSGDYRAANFVVSDGGADGLAITAQAATLASAMAGQFGPSPASSGQGPASSAPFGRFAGLFGPVLPHPVP